MLTADSFTLIIMLHNHMDKISDFLSHKLFVENFLKKLIAPIFNQLLSNKSKSTQIKFFFYLHYMFQTGFKSSQIYRNLQTNIAIIFKQKNTVKKRCFQKLLHISSFSVITGSHVHNL